MRSLVIKICLVFAVLRPAAQVKAPEPYGALPSERQLAWHEKEMYVLVHFTPTTFEDKEWGFGDADPAIFNPVQFDAGQIVKAARAGGFRGLVFVAKHHDGFALWPTATTLYNISKSPFRNGKGDMVDEFASACRNNGFSFGVYCSPWDRNNPAYGTAEYVKVYREQLRELYTRYGPLFMSWHDGANGGDGYYGGAREKRQIDRTTYYGWDTTWAMTRSLQPSANIFSDVGWDVRWVGNERGEAGETSWATFTPMPLPGKAKAGPGENRDDLNPTGTRNGKYWMPAECDVPLRKGWFFHPAENGTVKNAERLFDIYLKSVGRGSCLDLGLAPDTRGLLHENDVKALAEFGDLLRKAFSDDLAKKSAMRASNIRGGRKSPYDTKNLTDGDRYTYWSTDDGVTGPELVLEWKRPETFNLVKLRENIRLGQRIAAFEVDAWVDGAWVTAARGTSIGACRILKLDRDVTTTRCRLRITDSPVAVALSEFGIYRK
jgi:alpha-L-fucosidase